MRIIATITDRDTGEGEALSKAAPRRAARGVVFDHEDNVALLYIGQFPYYSLPGGGIDEDESIEEGLCREILEETGCHITDIAALVRIDENRGKLDFTQESYYFTANVEGEKGTPHMTEEEMEEQTEVRWYPIEEAIRLVENLQSDEYKLKFVRLRDVAALRYAASLCDAASQEVKINFSQEGFPSNAGA